jgi:hypothetical protein
MVGIVGEVYDNPQDDISDHGLRGTKSSSERAVIAAYLIDRILDATASVCAQLAHTPP